MKKLLFFLFLIFLGSTNISPTSANTIGPGDFIKLENSPAIYHINEKNERQYFTFGWIFKCYEPDYTKVKILPKDFNLEQFPSALQGAMPPRSGCGLVKSPASPSVYAFDNEGLRHKIKDEISAKTLYGAQWAQQVHDMPDFVLSLFPIGTVFESNSQSSDTPTQNTSQIWKPTPRTTWQWQLDSVPQNNFENVAVYDIDLFEATASDVKKLHDAGKKVICYVSVGSWEDWRDDADTFPKEILGNDYDGWKGEKWLDIRNPKLYPLLQKRFDDCKNKGFDGLEPDNIDGYDNETGFDISANDQIVFNKWLASEAHKRGLSIGLKNDPDQAISLEPYFDWALTEDCAPDEWCSEMKIFTDHNKAVFQTEYLDNDIDFPVVCAEAKQNKFSFILKNRDLDESIQICR